MTTAEPTASIVYVSFNTEINQITTDLLLRTMFGLAQRQVTHVHLLLSTVGGNVVNSVNAYNLLRGMPFELTTHNVGLVASAGNVLFQAGDKRLACPQTNFQFHTVNMNYTQGVNFYTPQVEDLLNVLQTNDKQIAEIMKERTKMDPTEFEELISRPQNKYADEALALGIIDEIRTVSIPAGVEVITITPNG